MGITGKQRGRHIFADGVGSGWRVYATDGPISGLGGLAVLNKAGVGAYTLAAPSSDGITLTLVNRTANAHIVTATGLLDDGTGAASKNTATFAAFPGATIQLVSYGNKWNAVAKNGVTVA